LNAYDARGDEEEAVLREAAAKLTIEAYNQGIRDEAILSRSFRPTDRVPPVREKARVHQLCTSDLILKSNSASGTDSLECRPERRGARIIGPASRTVTRNLPQGIAGRTIRLDVIRSIGINALPTSVNAQVTTFARRRTLFILVASMNGHRVALPCRKSEPTSHWRCREAGAKADWCRAE
jgi:hypothetical protein